MFLRKLYVEILIKGSIHNIFTYFKKIIHMLDLNFFQLELTHEFLFWGLAPTNKMKW